MRERVLEGALEQASLRERVLEGELTQANLQIGALREVIQWPKASGEHDAMEAEFMRKRVIELNTAARPKKAKQATEIAEGPHRLLVIRPRSTRDRGHNRQPALTSIKQIIGTVGVDHGGLLASRSSSPSWAVSTPRMARAYASAFVSICACDVLKGAERSMHAAVHTCSECSSGMARERRGKAQRR